MRSPWTPASSTAPAPATTTRSASAAKVSCGTTAARSARGRPAGRPAPKFAAATAKMDLPDSGRVPYLFFLSAQQTFQLFNFLARQLPVRDEVRQHRLERAAEDAVQKRGAGHVHTILLGHPRAVEIGPALLAEAQRALVHQAVEQRLGRPRMPGGIEGRERVDDFAGGEGRSLPDDAHDFPLGVGDSRKGWHVVLFCRLHL